MEIEFTKDDIRSLNWAEEEMKDARGDIYRTAIEINPIEPTLEGPNSVTERVEQLVGQHYLDATAEIEDVYRLHHRCDELNDRCNAATGTIALILGIGIPVAGGIAYVLHHVGKRLSALERRLKWNKETNETEE